MKINPSYLPISPGSNESREVLAPVERVVTPSRDTVREQRLFVARLKATDDDRREAENIVSRNHVNANLAEGLRTRRALSAYQGVARRDEQEYVSSVLGIDEFA